VTWQKGRTSESVDLPDTDYWIERARTHIDGPVPLPDEEAGS
jgi:hypothetical protein